MSEKHRGRATKKEKKKQIRATLRESLLPPYQAGGIPRTIRSLLDLAPKGLLAEGTIFEERDEAELAICEFNEMMDRKVEFKKYNDRLRSWCTHENCSYACNIRLRQFHMDGSERLVQVICNSFNHSCAPGRLNEDPCNYPTRVLAHLLLMNTHDERVLTLNESEVLLDCYTSRKTKRYTIDKVRKKYKILLYGENSKRIRLFPA